MKIEGLLDLLAFSDRRRKVLLILKENPKTLTEIREYFNVQSPEIIPQLKMLEKANLIYQEEKDKKYVLTEIGEIAIDSFVRLDKTLKIFEKEVEFWKEHELKGIPEEFRLRFCELGSYKIYESTPTDIFKPHDEYIKNLLKSKEIRGVSPAFHPEYPGAVVALAEKGANISLILTKDVFEKIKKEHKKELQKYLSFKNASMYMCNEEIKVVFTATDFFFVLRLFLKQRGTYDFYRNVISYEKSALKWGDDLFNYYKKRSERVEPQNF